MLDADALNAIAANPDVLSSRSSSPVVIITPHPGEMAQLAHTTVDAVQANRVDVARNSQSSIKSTSFLKGYRTLIATPTGPASSSTLSEIRRMATGGSR